MAVTIEIPTALRSFCDGKKSVSVEAKNVGEAIKELAAQRPAIAKHLYNEAGELRNYINIFLGDTNIKSLEDQKTALNDGATLILVPAIAGGL
ncbi:MAG: MoaD/ThiS family protein [Helicobacteraceae bacterium]|jgi:molybdopterin converting factor small subunit|nr:MoaD/ThiS family protein [Helicobacteraceae bacterium]